MKRQIILVIFLLMNSKTIYSQINQEWTSRYGQGFANGSAIATDNTGNVFVTGSSGITASSIDLVTIKYSSSGKQLWIQRYNGTGNRREWSTSIMIDHSNNIIVTGCSEGEGSGYDYITIKYSSIGSQIWIQRYSSMGNHFDIASSIDIDVLDNIYITGVSNGKAVTIKYDSTGNQNWINSFGSGNNSETSSAIFVDKHGNTYLTGDTSGDSTTQRDIVTIKYDTFGTMKWVKRYNGPRNENDYGLDVGVDSDGNVYVCGGIEGDLYYDDYVTVKYDSSGNEEWSISYNGTENYLDQARSLVIDNSNNIYITGYSTHTGTGYDFTTIKYNSRGDQLWLARYNNGSNDMANKMIIDNYGNLYITGESDGSGTSFDYATVKYDSSGNQLWVKRYDYSGQYGDNPTSLAVDNNGSIFVTGSSNRDILTIKYSQLTGVNPISLENPSIFKLEQNYPNPFNPVTNINFSLPNNKFVILMIYDILGNEVNRIINERKNAGTYSVQFNGNYLPSGIYFYSLFLDGKVADTKRMVLLK